MATIATQPLIVAKVGLQSRPPPGRGGKPFKSFGEVMRFIVEREGLVGLFKGIGPQITKGLLVQGLLMMTKERYVLSTGFFLFFFLYILLTSNRMELVFLLLFAYLRKIKEKQLSKTVDSAAAKAKTSLPATLK